MRSPINELLIGNDGDVMLRQSVQKSIVILAEERRVRFHCRTEVRIDA